eukprot:CFRG1341T1
MIMTNEYERMRQKNIEENQATLDMLGISPKKVVKRRKTWSEGAKEDADSPKTEISFLDSTDLDYRGVRTRATKASDKVCYERQLREESEKRKRLKAMKDEEAASIALARELFNPTRRSSRTRVEPNRFMQLTFQKRRKLEMSVIEVLCPKVEDELIKGRDYILRFKCREDVAKGAYVALVNTKGRSDWVYLIEDDLGAKMHPAVVENDFVSLKSKAWDVEVDQITPEDGEEKMVPDEEVNGNLRPKCSEREDIYDDEEIDVGNIDQNHDYFNDSNGSILDGIFIAHGDKCSVAGDVDSEMSELGHNFTAVITVEQGTMKFDHEQNGDNVERIWELQWTVPMDVDAGTHYSVELASHKKVSIGESAEFSIRDQVGIAIDNDIGVWCQCGDTECLSSKENVEWIACSVCKSWQHCKCHSISSALIADEDIFECLWCKTNKPSVKAVMKMIKMIEKVCVGYRRLHQDSFCSTPTRAVDLLGSLLLATDKKVADLGAGTGNLSCVLPKGTLCIELNNTRHAEGKERLPQHTWHRGNVLSPAFVSKHVCQQSKKFDLVVANPDFEVALQFLYLALLMLNNSASARAMFILPSDYFEASASRSRIFKLLDVHIEEEYRMGHLGYYADNRGAEKSTVDSIFVLKRGREGKFSHTTVNARLAGMM